MMFVHGGSWNAGHAGLDLNQCRRWASYGYAAFSINYRLQTNRLYHGTPAPAQFVDVQLALRWIRAHAASLRASGAQASCFGDSSGASLCEQLALYPGLYPSRGDAATRMYTNFSSKAQAFVSEFGPALFGPAPLPATLAREYATNGPAGVLVQGSWDPVVSAANSQAVYGPLRDHGRPVLYIPVGSGHEYSGASNATISAIKIKQLRFIADHNRYYGFPVARP